MNLRTGALAYLGPAVLILLAACSTAVAPAVAPTAQSPPPAPSGAAPPDDRSRFSRAGWKTDFTTHSVPLSEIVSGGPARDGIPPIDRPELASTAEAGAWLKGQEPVVALEVGGDARAYPLQILIWHEIVNDTIGGVPVAVTFCPLCNTAISFDRRIEGIDRPLRFGTTGNLRESDLVMWSDDPGETWWQQITGDAIVGALTGTRLRPLPAQIVSFADFSAAYQDGRVLNRVTGFTRPYGSNPYAGYDDVNGSPFLFSGSIDGRLAPMERVVAVELNGEIVAYPFRELLKARVANDAVGGTPIVVFHRGGTVSALDNTAIPASRDIGATGVFERSLDGRTLTFRAAGGGFEDAETGSTWDITGRATAGPLAGRRLAPVVHDNRFWFVAAVVRPNLRLWAP